MLRAAGMKELTLDTAVATLRGGGVIAYPTEAVWGLGCDPSQQQAVHALLRLKQRPVDKGMILVAADLEQLHGWARLDALPSERQREVLSTWPGANTWILPAGPLAPAWITGDHSGLAVRISAHPLVAALCRAWGGPLVSTSANLAGQPPVQRREALDPRLLPLLDGILDGTTGGLAQPTPIRDALSGTILRP